MRNFLLSSSAVILSMSVFKADLAIQENATCLNTSSLEQTVASKVSGSVEYIFQDDIRLAKPLVKLAVNNSSVPAKETNTLIDVLTKDNEAPQKVWCKFIGSYKKYILKNLNKIIFLQPQNIFLQNERCVLDVLARKSTRDLTVQNGILNRVFEAVSEKKADQSFKEFFEQQITNHADEILAAQEQTLEFIKVIKKTPTPLKEDSIAQINELVQRIENNKRDYLTDLKDFLAILKRETIFGSLQKDLVSILNDEQVDEETKKSVLYKFILRLKEKKATSHVLIMVAKNIFEELRKGELTLDKESSFIKECQKTLDEAEGKPWLKFTDQKLVDISENIFLTIVTSEVILDEQKPTLVAHLVEICTILAQAPGNLAYSIPLIIEDQLKGLILNWQGPVTFEASFKKLIDKAKSIAKAVYFPFIEGMKIEFREDDYKQGTYDDTNPNPDNLVETIDYAGYEVSEAMFNDPRVILNNEKLADQLGTVDEQKYLDAKEAILKRFRILENSGIITQEMLKDGYYIGTERKLKNLLVMDMLVNRFEDQSLEIQKAITVFKGKVIFLSKVFESLEDSVVAPTLARLSIAGNKCSTRAQSEVDQVYNAFTASEESQVHAKPFSESISQFLAEKRKQIIERIALEKEVSYSIRLDGLVPGSEEYIRTMDELISTRISEPEHTKMDMLKRAHKLIGLPGNYDMSDWYRLRGNAGLMSDEDILDAFKQKYTVEYLVKTLRDEMNNYDESLVKQEHKKYLSRFNERILEYENESGINPSKTVCNVFLLAPSIAEDDELNEVYKFTRRSTLSILIGLGYVKKKGSA